MEEWTPPVDTIEEWIQTLPKFAELASLFEYTEWEQLGEFEVEDLLTIGVPATAAVPLLKLIIKLDFPNTDESGQCAQCMELMALLQEKDATIQQLLSKEDDSESELSAAALFEVDELVVQDLENEGNTENQGDAVQVRTPKHAQETEEEEEELTSPGEAWDDHELSREELLFEMEEAKNRIENFLNSRFTYYTELRPMTTGIDTMKWGKLLGDLKFTDPRLRVDRTRGDLIFSKIKKKGVRQIDFSGFCKAMKEVARYLCPKDGDDALLVMIDSVKPLKKAKRYKTSARASAIVSRLTDTSLYTGAHKQRFDKNGKGRGKEGRVSAQDPRDLNDIVRRNSGVTPRHKKNRHPLSHKRFFSSPHSARQSTGRTTTPPSRGFR